PARLDGRPLPGRARGDVRRAELVRSAGGALGERGPGPQRRRGPLSRAGRLPPRRAVRGRGRAGHRRRGRADHPVPRPRLPGREASRARQRRRDRSRDPRADRGRLRRSPAAGGCVRKGHLHGREGRRPVHLAGPGHHRAGRGGPRQGRLRAGLRAAADPARARLGPPLGAVRPGAGRAGARGPRAAPANLAPPWVPVRRVAGRAVARGPRAAPAHLPPAADGLGALGGPRRRDPGPRAVRRGLPPARLLGRDVRLPVSHAADAGPGPGVAALPVAPADAGPQGGARDRAGGCDGSVDAAREGGMSRCQRGASGGEERQTMHLTPRSGRWLPDNSRLQRHVGLAVAYKTWQYYSAPADLDFLASHGAELILEIARFWAGAATYDRAADRYDLCGVMGPDEYHDGYPWRAEPGLDNKAHTNALPTRARN